MESTDEAKALAIRDEIAITKRAIDELEDEFKEAKKRLVVKIGNLRKECPHPLWRYVPDASGNNDSYHYCEYCGTEN